MKLNRWLLIPVLFAVCFASCKAQKNALSKTNDANNNASIDSTSTQNPLLQQINALGNKTIGDSTLQQLQIKSDVLIISSVENFAWARTINYTIIAQQDGKWKGYTYKTDLRLMNAKKQLLETSANSVQCDSLFTFLTENKVWEIRGDFGRRFCDSSNTKCGAINDATTSRMYIATKTNFINPSYYAPEFYEQCCPDKNRTLFLAIVQKVEKAVSKGPEQ